MLAVSLSPWQSMHFCSLLYPYVQYRSGAKGIFTKNKTHEDPVYVFKFYLTMQGYLSSQ